MIVVDMRGHLGPRNVLNWQQIAFGAEDVPWDYRLVWLDNDNRATPLCGVWHRENPARFAATARERLHAIMFVAERRYEEGALTEGARIFGNPHLFRDEAEAKKVLGGFPLQPTMRRHA
jgi:hypothetical protein